MDFDNIDIHAFLKASMPVRFQDISPYDFEKFIATLFREDGYDVEETTYSGDYGADMLVRKDRTSTAIQVKRYAPGTQVTVGDVNQVIGAMTYYKATNALVITTSDFTAQAISLAKTTNVILWNWARLEKYVSKIYFNGQEYQQYFGQFLDELPDEDTSLDQPFELRLKEVNEVDDPKGEPCIELRLDLTSDSERNLTVHVDLPLVVSKKTKKQVTALQWKEHYFFHGVIVSGATVELACFFPRAQIGHIKPGDRIILNVHVAGEENPVIIDRRLRNPSGNCYIVTYCYGRGSPEYHLMIRWRDQVLQRSSIGRKLIDMYYKLSPVLVELAGKRTWVARVLKFSMRWMVLRIK